jgi:hypothetical protein
MFAPAQVKVVRAKDDGRILAMKCMKKTAMILKNQVRASTEWYRWGKGR